jgi:rhodanese-related sulfurtransferase
MTATPAALLRYITLFLALFCCRGALGQAPLEAAPDTRRDSRAGGAECGVYALLAAASALGHPIDQRVLLEGNYVSSAAGSTGSDLIRGAHDVGLDAIACKSIGAVFLRSLDFPVLLNLKRPGSPAECSGHWIAWLGEQDGKAIVFDTMSPNRTKTISYGELLLTMTGDGILVQKADGGNVFGTLKPRLFSWLPYLVFVGFIAGTIVLFGRRRKSGLVRELLQIGIAAGVWIVSLALLDKAGLTRNPGAVAWIQSLHGREKFRDVSFEQLESFRKRSDVTVIDARSPAAWEYGHIPGAVNVPIEFECDNFVQATKSLSKSQCLVVYCNNPDCTWADTVSQRLTAFGYDDVRIFRPGLAGYLERRDESKQSGNETGK